jgi:hypothetical protein
MNVLGFNFFYSDIDLVKQAVIIRGIHVGNVSSPSEIQGKPKYLILVRKFHIVTSDSGTLFETIFTVFNCCTVRDRAQKQQESEPYFKI